MRGSERPTAAPEAPDRVAAAHPPLGAEPLARLPGHGSAGGAGFAVRGPTAPGLPGGGLGVRSVTAMLALQRSAGNALLARRVRVAAPRVLARQHVRMVSGRYVGDLPGNEANVREDVLVALERLVHLWSITAADYTTERAAVAAKPPNDRLTAAEVTGTIAALRRNEEQSIAAPVAQTQLGTALTAPVGAGMANAKADVQALLPALNANWNVPNDVTVRELAAVAAGPDPVDNAQIPGTLRGIAAFKAAYVGGTSRRSGPLAGTGPPTPQAVASRDTALITPGTRTRQVTVGGVTTTVADPFKDTVQIAGRPVTYRADLWQAMDTVRGYMFPRTNAMFARPRMQMSAFEAIGDAAKAQVDGLWGTHGAFGPRFHTGTNLFDASARTGNAENMIEYLVDNQRELGVVRGRHNASHQPGNPETAIADQFKRDYVAHGSNRRELEVIDQGWPALNSAGRVFIQPFEGATPQATRRVRWEAFQTMIHEYFHSLNHPNYYRIARTLGGDQESVLVEGGASVMTDETWRRIYPRVLESNAALRAAVEGAPAAFDPRVIPPIGDVHYHPQFEQAREIQRAFTPPNFHAAFLTGRMDLIGYPAEAPRSVAAATRSQQFLVPPTGVTTLADVAYVTGSTVEQLNALNGLAVTATVRPGQSILVPGRP